MGDTHPIIGSINGPSVLIRAESRSPIDVSDCKKFYQTLDLSEVDLSFAGRLSGRNPTHRALEQLAVGDPVNLKQAGERWQITDQNGVVVGRLAKKFKPPQGAEFIDGSVFAISTRYRSDSSDEYQERLKRDEWSVVLPEFIYQA